MYEYDSNNETTNEYDCWSITFKGVKVAYEELYTLAIGTALDLVEIEVEHIFPNTRSYAAVERLKLKPIYNILFAENGIKKIEIGKCSLNETEYRLFFNEEPPKEEQKSSLFAPYSLPFKPDPSKSHSWDTD